VRAAGPWSTGAILLVDASEAPPAPDPLCSEKALDAHLKIVVSSHKIDRPDARPDEVLDEIYDLLIDLNATDDQLEFSSALLRSAATASPRKP